MVIDVHTHVGELVWERDRLANPTDLTVDYEMRVEMMDKNGIDKAVILPTSTYDRTEGIEATRALNDEIYELAQHHDRFVEGIATVEPTHGDNAIEELERIADLGFKGVAWHHRFQGVPIDEPVTIDCLERLEDLGLVGFLHCVAASDSEAIRRIDNVAEYTDQPLILLSSLYSPENIEQAITLGQKYDNLYFGTAGVFSLMRPIERLVEELGAERLVFGSDLYTRPLTYRNSANLYQIRNAEIAEDEREQILSGNLQRLLAL